MVTTVRGEQIRDDTVKIIDLAGRSLVGKIMKRIEISQNLLQSKVEIKEVVYEEFRNVKTQLECFSAGMQKYHVEIERPTPKKQE